MSTNDISPNGLLGSSPRKHKKPLPSPRHKSSTIKQSTSRQQTPTGSILKPVSSNFFYRHDETSKKATTPSRSRVLIGSREANEWKKRKAAEQDVGVPWMLGKPMNSGKGFRASGALQESQHDSKRIKLAPVDDNMSHVKRVWPISISQEEPRERNALDARRNRKQQKKVPLFMPSPSPKKLASTTSQPQVSDKKAKQLLDDLLEGLDTDAGFFDDDLDFKSDDEDTRLGENGVGIGVGKSEAPLLVEKKDIKVEQETDFEMCDWMKVDELAVKEEPEAWSSDKAKIGAEFSMNGDDVTPDITTKLKSDPGQDTDSEYADDFDYDNINLDDLDLAANNDVSGTATPAVDSVPVYPIFNPPIHDVLNPANAASYDPLPWRRCIVESVSAENDTSHRFSQSEKVVFCRVVESFAAHGSEDAKGETGVHVGTMLKCRLKGEWADLVLANGECRDEIRLRIRSVSVG